MATGYVMMRSGDLSSDLDVERHDAERVEATLAWGDNVLATKHFALTDPITLGDAPGCDFALPDEIVGSSSLNILSHATGSTYVNPPRGNPIELKRGQPTSILMGEFTLTLEIVAAGKKVAGTLAAAVQESALKSVGASAFMHVAIFASLAFFLPSLSGDNAEEISRDQMYAMRAYLDATAEHEKEPPPSDGDQGATSGANDPGAGGGKAKGPEGAMGKQTATNSGHYSAKGDAKEVTLARDQELAIAKDFGMIGLLSSSSLSDPNAPIVPWGSVLNGSDKESHMGNLWAGDIGDAFGSGLGLTGPGEGGGGNAEGIGINDIGGLGRSLDGHLGNGTCAGPGPCRGIGHGRLPGAHVPGSGPSWRMAKDFEANGHLPAEVIQRVVRQNQGRFRNCYEAGLRSNPSLAGRVAVKFIIDRQGGVSMAGDSGSDLPDATVRECVVRSFYSLSFPAPGNGTVRVTYPILFSPSDG